GSWYGGGEGTLCSSCRYSMRAPEEWRPHPGCGRVQLDRTDWHRHRAGHRRIRPMTSVTTNMTRKMKNRIFAMLAAPAAIPPKPKKAATRAITKKTAA